MRSILFSFCTLISLNLCWAQDSNQLKFGYNEFIERVLEHHPVAYQANLRTGMGEAKILQARGGFDPKAQIDVAQKYFESKEYYDLGEGKLKVPTWFGLEFEGGYERNEGVFLNPENNTPNAGLLFAGISVPIGQGLFIDERRLALRQAQALIQKNEAERRSILPYRLA